MEGYKVNAEWIYSDSGIWSRIHIWLDSSIDNSGMDNGKAVREKRGKSNKKVRQTRRVKANSDEGTIWC